MAALKGVECDLNTRFWGKALRVLSRVVNRVSIARTQNQMTRMQSGYKKASAFARGKTLAGAGYKINILPSNAQHEAIVCCADYFIGNFAGVFRRRKIHFGGILCLLEWQELAESHRLH